MTILRPSFHLDVTPKNLFSRFLLIIIIPIFLLLAISAYIFYERHWENVSTRMQDALINDIKLLVELRPLSPVLFLHASDLLNFEAEIINAADEHAIDSHSLDYSDSELQRFNANLMIHLGKRTKSFYVKGASRIRTLVYHEDEVMIFTYSNKKIHSPTTMVFILWMIGTAVFLIIIAVTFMKNQVRAIANLALAAERLGKGQEMGIFHPSGAREVRVAGKAFLRMKERIERQISYRTDLLAHISHDLRTPLTRIKLQLALLKEKKEAQLMEQDIFEMEKMIEGYITFAKEEGNESMVRFNVIDDIKNCLNKFRDNRIKLILPTSNPIISLKREAFKRVINNLLSNAQKYCKKKILVSAYFSKTHFYFIVEDDGKGIAEKDYESVFAPFTKLNNKKDGFGLGLAIVKNIVLSHGGKIKLAASNLGGLKVSIRIPI